MHTLRGSERSRVLPLVPASHEAGHMTFVHAVLEGAMEGLVVVDEPARPRSALVASYSGFAFALGAADPAFARAAIPHLRSFKAAEPPALWAVSDAWTHLLRPLFSASSRRQRLEFLPTRGPIRAEPELPGGSRLVTDQAELISRYRDALAAERGAPGETWLAMAWGGPGAFAERSFGRGIVRDGRLVAICAACAIANRADPPEAEIEIWTATTARRGGLAMATATAFIQECHERGLVPAWTCEAGNEPSRRLAEKLGFRCLRQIEGYQVVDYIE